MKCRDAVPRIARTMLLLADEKAPSDPDAAMTIFGLAMFVDTIMSECDDADPIAARQIHDTIESLKNRRAALC